MKPFTLAWALPIIGVRPAPVHRIGQGAVGGAPSDGRPRGLIQGLAAVLAVITVILGAPTPATAQTITEFTLPSPNSLPRNLAAGPDGALWFTQQNGNRIGRIDTAGVITEFTLPTAGSAPLDITAGPDGALWFTQLSGNRIGRITTGAPPPAVVPTMTEWAMILFALMLAGGAAVTIQRRRQAA